MAVTANPPVARGVDFYSPDTFNYATLEISSDGKSLRGRYLGHQFLSPEQLSRAGRDCRAPPYSRLPDRRGLILGRLGKLFEALLGPAAQIITTTSRIDRAIFNRTSISSFEDATRRVGVTRAFSPAADAYDRPPPTPVVHDGAVQRLEWGQEELFQERG